MFEKGPSLSIFVTKLAVPNVPQMEKEVQSLIEPETYSLFQQCFLVLIVDGGSPPVVGRVNEEVGGA